MLSIVRCLWFVVCCYLLVVLLIADRGSLLVIRCVMFVRCCVMRVACCLRYVVVRCLLLVAWSCLLFAV